MAKTTTRTFTESVPVTTTAQEPEVRELGPQMGEGLPVVTTDESYGYDPEKTASTEVPAPEVPQYDLPDEHNAPDEVEEAEQHAEGEEKAAEKVDEKPLSREDYADYGLTEEQARQLDAKGELDSVLKLIDRRILAEDRQKAEAKPADTKQSDADTVELGLDPELYDEGLVKQFTGLINYVNKLEAKLEQITGAARSSRMDTFFASLGDEYADVFGKEPLDELPSKSPKRQLRTEVEATMDALAAHYQKRGETVPGEKTLQMRAVHAVAGDKVQELATKRVAQQVRDAKGQFIAKPTHREGKPLSRSERAAEYAENFYKRKGM